MATTEDERTGSPLRSVEDMARDGEDAAAEGEEEATDDGTPQLVLEGLGTALSSNVGGKKPMESVFKMSSVSLPIAGGVQLAKDTEMWIAVPVAIDDVHISNRRRQREIVGVVRTHTGIPIGQPIILDGPPAGVE